MLKDKVIVVTGAGGGIGRDFAWRWPRPAPRSWSTTSARRSTAKAAAAPARRRRSCDEITGVRREGGAPTPTASPNPDGAERMIKAAVDNFGRIDGVMNNAGILRDRIFHHMSHDGLEAGDRRASQRRVQHQPRRRQLLQGAGSRAPSCTSPRPRA